MADSAAIRINTGRLPLVDNLDESLHVSGSVLRLTISTTISQHPITRDCVLIRLISRNALAELHRVVI
jgi:hypothetical protein